MTNGQSLPSRHFPALKTCSMAIPTVDPILECGDIIFDWDGPVKKADIYQLNKELLLVGYLFNVLFYSPDFSESHSQKSCKRLRRSRAKKSATNRVPEA